MPKKLIDKLQFAGKHIAELQFDKKQYGPCLTFSRECYVLWEGVGFTY